MVRVILSKKSNKTLCKAKTVLEQFHPVEGMLGISFRPRDGAIKATPKLINKMRAAGILEE